MKITKAEVIQVAHLARLTIDEDDIEMFADQIGEILNYMDTIKQADTRDTAGTSHAISQVNAFREDELKPSLAKGEVLANAPNKDDGDFLVPKVI
jgi:aspartyl-tRNA(Asn)/glutamyl-tRNA(Gln) amidotransferase subunit C